MKRGDVYDIHLPPPDASPVGSASAQLGREQHGDRPAIIVRADGKCANIPTVLVVPLTSQLRALEYEGAVRIVPTPENGLTVESAALVHQVRPLDAKRLLTQRGRLSAKDMSLIDEQLRMILGL